MTEALLSSPPQLGLLPEVALVLDAHGDVTSASPPAAVMFGQDPVGATLSSLIPEPARLWSAVEGLAPGRDRRADPARGPARERRAVRARRQRARARRRRPAVRAARARPPGARARSTPPSTRCRSGWRCSTPTASTSASTPRCARCSRAPEHELIGMRDNLLTHPDDRQSDIDAAWRILRGELEHLAVREALRAPGRRASSGRWPTSPSCATSTTARCAGSGSSRTSPSCAGWRCATR